MADIITEVQAEVTRLRDMISTTKAYFPNRNMNFVIYEFAISEAESAIREQDAVALIRILPELQKME